MKTNGIVLMMILFCTALFSVQVNAQLVQVGSGNLVTAAYNASPVSILFSSTRIQIVYRKSELNAAGAFGGKISHLGFKVVQAPAFGLPNYTIYLGHTTQADASTHITTATQLVYQNSLYLPDTTGFNMLTLSNQFVWNGQDNIVVDICWNLISAFSFTGTVLYYNDPAYTGAQYISDDTENMCGEITEIPTSKPQIRFLFLPEQGSNAGISASNLVPVACNGTQAAVIATVSNLGTDVIDSVMVGWSVNGVSQTPAKLTLPLDTVNGTGTNSRQVTLGNLSYSSGNIYNILIWSYLPNNTVDSKPQDDTLHYTTRTGLGGTFTIGGTAPDYATISTALQDIQNKGLCSNVTFNIRSGIYTEQLILGDFIRTDTSNQLIIKSESNNHSDVVIKFDPPSSAEYVVQLDGTSNVTFRSLTIQ